MSEFISDCTKKSVRTMYLDVLKASVDFLLEMNLAPDNDSDSVTAIDIKD